MGACKVCGEIYGVQDLESGICKKCIGENPEAVKKIEIENSKEKIKTKSNNMLGIALIIVAILVGLYGIALDTTVDTGYGSRVHNIGLMGLQSNLLMAGGLLLLIGVLVLLLKSNKTNETSTETSSASVQLIKLGEMHEKGLITKEEFEAQKIKLL